MLAALTPQDARHNTTSEGQLVAMGKGGALR